MKEERKGRAGGNDGRKGLEKRGITQVLLVLK